METLSASLAFCAGNSPVTGEFPAQGPVTRSFDVFFNLCLNKRLSKQSWGWWFETPSWSLWHHCNARERIICMGRNNTGWNEFYVFRFKYHGWCLQRCLIGAIIQSIVYNCWSGTPSVSLLPVLPNCLTGLDMYNLKLTSRLFCDNDPVAAMSYHSYSRKRYL